jgi:hypothetical protein
MALEHDAADQTQAAATPAREQPLNRRRALRVLSALAATAGAAALAAARPKEALADADVTVTNGSTANYGIYAAPTGFNRPIVTTGVRGVLGFADVGVNFTLPSGFSAGVQGATAGQIGVAGTGNDQAVGVEGIVAAEDASVHFLNTSAGVLGTSSTRSGVVGASTVVHGIVGQTAAPLTPAVPNDDQNQGAGFSPSGVFGNATGGGHGVTGLSITSTGMGVYGISFGTGVFGLSVAGGIGVSGQTTSSDAAHPAVQGLNAGTGTGVFGNSLGGGIGVSGQTSSPFGGNPAVQGVNSGNGPNGGGPAVVGFSPFGTGVGGGSGSGIGFGGISTSGPGVSGQSTTGPAIVGLVTGASNGTNYAGHFKGGAGVLVEGTFTVMPPGGKSAAVRGPSGSLVRLYCMESPESWFEDFGKGQLSSGSATVQLEPGFAGVVKTDEYHVFLTPHGETNGLHVANHTPSSFVVREGHGGTSNVSFSYRVVAKRKDIEGARLEHVEEPPEVQLLKLPEPPATPATPQPLPTLPAQPPASPGRRG